MKESTIRAAYTQTGFIISLALLLMLSTERVSAHDKDDVTYEETGVATALAHTVIPEATALTARETLDCLTRTFPGEDRVAEIPGTRLEFIQGGRKPAPVVVTFVATFPIAQGDRLPSGSLPAGANIILEIDGDRVDVVSRNGGALYSPEGRQLLPDGTPAINNGTHGFTFVTEPLPPGNHEVRMLWLNNFLTGTGTICMFERTLLVQHR